MQGPGLNKGKPSDVMGPVQVNTFNHFVSNFLNKSCGWCPPAGGRRVSAHTSRVSTT